MTAGSADLKRKRDPLVAMLKWVPLVAKIPDKLGVTGTPVETSPRRFCFGARCFQTLIAAVARPRLR
jgi:hypothetical protein